MANTQNFEQLLEYIVNGEQEKAEELFHSLVVNKSREIYEGLFEEEMKDVDMDEAKDEDCDDEDEEKVDEAFIAFSEEPGAAGFGGDPTDDMMGDIGVGGDEGDGEEEMPGDVGGDDMDDTGMSGEGDIEDRVMDLEDALEDLKAEFDALMADEEGEPEHNDGENDPDFGGDDDSDDDADADFGGDDEEEKEEEPAESFQFEDIEDIDLSPVEQMREYVEKVGDPWKGLKSSETSGTFTKSPVAGKNDMGGTTKNIVAGGEGSTKGTAGGLLNPSTKEENFGNVNVPGGKAGVKHLKNVPAGHGAEKKGKSDGVSAKPLLKPQVG